MNAYTEYARLYPEELEIAAVVEPNPLRREQYASTFGIPVAQAFASWEECLQRPRMADAVFLCTPDPLHYRPALAALEKGYHILLEKPIAQSWEQCSEIASRAAACGRIVGVCHVLRYHPYYRKIKAVLESGVLGEVISVSHRIEIGIERMTHSFVRGLWRKERESNPILLSKACHDLDLIVWLTGRKCRSAESCGSLKWFRACNAPAGSTHRCVDGCAVEQECPYSAVELYYRKKRWLRHFDLEGGEDPDAVIRKELQEGPYGRCVYRCDNDVADNQVAVMQLEGNITVDFSLNGFTREGGRRTRIVCSRGELSGDEKRLAVTAFRKEPEVYDFSDTYGECNFHGGADLHLVADFLKAVRAGSAAHFPARIEEVLESHRIAFEIEKKRKMHDVI
jgi:predicted dehydrogenase